MAKADKPLLAYGEMREKLEPDDVDGKIAVLTIAKAERKNFGPKDGNRQEYKIAIVFEEFPEKEYVVNATSYKTLVEKLGDDEDEWIGQPCVVGPTTTTFNKQTYEKLHVVAPDRWDKVMRGHKPDADDEEDDMPTSVPRKRAPAKKAARR